MLHICFPCWSMTILRDFGAQSVQVSVFPSPTVVIHVTVFRWFFHQFEVYSTDDSSKTMRNCSESLDENQPVISETWSTGSSGTSERPILPQWVELHDKWSVIIISRWVPEATWRLTYGLECGKSRSEWLWGCFIGKHTAAKLAAHSSL